MSVAYTSLVAPNSPESDVFFVTFYIRHCAAAQYLCWVSCDRKHWAIGQTGNKQAAAKFETRDEAEAEARKFFADWDNAEYQVCQC